MSIITQIMTSTNETEIIECLNLLKRSTANLGLIHESINVENLGAFTESECISGFEGITLTVQYVQ